MGAAPDDSLTAADAEASVTRHSRLPGSPQATLRFLVSNDRGSRAQRPQDLGEAIIATSQAPGPAALPARPPAPWHDGPHLVRVGSVEVGDEVGGSAHAPIRLLTQVTSCPGVVSCVCDAGERIERKHLDRGIVPLPRISEDRHQTLLGPWSVVRGVHGRQQALTERGLLATAGVAVPGGRGFECRPRCRDLSEPTQNPTQVYLGERGQAHIAGGLGLGDRELQGGRPSFVVAGLALRSCQDS